MIKKIRERLADEEAGFTLIELLVVVIIIGILAAIAIPTFLNQREGAWRSSVESDLRNLATNMETCYAQDGNYTSIATATGPAQVTVCTGVTQQLSDGTVLSAVTIAAGDQTYVLTGAHENIAGSTVEYDSQAGGIQEWAP